MSDTWYRKPLDLPPYEDGSGRSWSVTGELLSGEEPEPEWPDGWPKDTRRVLMGMFVDFCLDQPVAPTGTDDLR